MGCNKAMSLVASIHEERQHRTGKHVHHKKLPRQVIHTEKENPLLNVIFSNIHAIYIHLINQKIKQFSGIFEASVTSDRRDTRHTCRLRCLSTIMASTSGKTSKAFFQWVPVLRYNFPHKKKCYLSTVQFSVASGLESCCHPHFQLFWLFGKPQLAILLLVSPICLTSE